MTAPTEEKETTTDPPDMLFHNGTAWVPVPAPSPAPDDEPAESRSEAPTPSRSRRKHVAAIGAAGGTVGGVALFQAFGVMGLIAAGGIAAGLIAAPVAAVVMWKRRGRNRTGMGRRLRGQRLTRRNASSRLGSTGLSRRGKTGRGLKLGSGKGPSLGKGKGGLKLGGRGKAAGAGARGKGPLGKLLSSRGAGKSAVGSRSKGLLGGKSGKLLGGKSGSVTGSGKKLFGGARKSTAAASRSGGLPGRAKRSSMNLGRRGGKAARGAVGRWSKSTAGGAGILGRKTAVAARRRTANMTRRAANTRAGRRVGKAVQAAKQAHSLSTGKTPFARWRFAARAAHSQMPGGRYSTWATGIGAGVIALLALLHQRVKAWRAKRNPPPAADASVSGGTSTGSTPRGPAKSGRSDSGWAGRSTTHDSDEYAWRAKAEDVWRRYKAEERFRSTAPPPRVVRVERIPDEPPVSRPAIAAPLRALGPGGTTERKEPRMSGFALLTAAEEFAAVCAKYKPESAHGLAPDFDQLPQVIATFAAGIRHFALRISEEEPVEAAVEAALFDLFNGIYQQVTTAEQIGPIHRQVHARDIDRVENPRRNESRWNAPVHA